MFPLLESKKFRSHLDFLIRRATFPRNISESWLGIAKVARRRYYGTGNRETSKEGHEWCTGFAVIDSVGQFTDGFTITIKLCSRGKLYS